MIVILPAAERAGQELAFFSLLKKYQFWGKWLGASIKYVPKNFGILDLLPPLVHVCTIWDDPLLADIQIWSEHPHHPHACFQFQFNLSPFCFVVILAFWEKQAKPEMQEKRDAIIHSLILIF